MKILLISIGTRGDMEPFLAIGEILAEKGHQVICAFPEQFRDLVDGSGMEFTSLGPDYIEMLESDLGKEAMGTEGSGLKKWYANIKLAGHQTEINQELVQKQYEIIENQNPDRILYNGKATYPVIWGLDHPGKHILVCPLPYMHYVKDHTHILFNNNFGPWFNKLTYSLADFGVITTLRISANWLKLTKQITRKQLKKALSTSKAIYTISPSLFPRPDYWPENLQVLGFHMRHQATNWQPDEDLTNFLEDHKNDRMLFITFGSMTNPDPEGKTKIMQEILERNDIPAIINTASGGLVELEEYDPELLHFVSEIPYEWIFPKVYGVIHHGGSGTTHLALRHGCATMIVPHIIDQFVWDKIIYEMGTGPRGVKINRFTAKALETKILELIHNGSYKEKAEGVGSQLREEDFKEEIYEAIIQD